MTATATATPAPPPKPSKMVLRATTMVSWFIDQPHHATTMTDDQQAHEFHALAPDQNWLESNGFHGNVGLVRTVRRWISKQRTGAFEEFVFNTKRAGRGVTYTHMTDRSTRLRQATIGTAAQVQAIEQHERRLAEERGRICLKLMAESEEWFRLQDYQRSMACRDAVSDIEQYGRLRPTTKEAFERLGLVIP